MRHFEEQLGQMFGRVVVMGSTVEAMIARAVRGLIERNDALFEEVFVQEREVNELQVEVDETAVRLTALQQPMASDVRFLFMASRIGGELERIGDQAINICQNALHLADGPPLKAGMPSAGLVDIPIMAELAQKMVRDSLTAMIKRDVEMANRVLGDDDKVDVFRDQIFRLLQITMMADPGAIQPALSLILIARNLERIGDHATNIGEEVIYWIQGRDVRHGKGLSKQPSEQGGGQDES